MERKRLLRVCLVGLPTLVIFAAALFLFAAAPTATLTGRVVDLDGRAVGGAVVSVGKSRTETASNGWFRIRARAESQWVTVRHPAFLSRTRAVSPDAPVLVRLTPDDGETISIHFLGDTMFGRRFYDANEDGKTWDGLLQPGAGVREHHALLRPVQPLVENAHLTVLNLESPLLPHPYFDPAGPRPPWFHQTKDFAFGSDFDAAAALQAAGVDVVDLGNNHLYDGLEAGVASTITALQQAGYAAGKGHFGAGLSPEVAWRPAVVTVRGQTVAFLGCTSITGREHPVSYVAAGQKGGAAEANVHALRRAVRSARARYDVVIVMIHGGYEYARHPSEQIRQLTTVARQAGATLVINHHPHVIGGLDWNGSSLVAWTLGNFLFDQTVWPTFNSYMLAVHLRRGKVARVYAEPLIIEGYTPKGLTGEMADYVAREAAGREPGPFLVEDGAMEADLKGVAFRREVRAPFRADPAIGNIFRLDKGWWLSGVSGTGRVQLGRDLLWVGSFEDEVVGARFPASAPLWDFTSTNRRTGPKYAFRGHTGARLQRGSEDLTDALLAPLHRFLVQPGTALSVVGKIRTSPKAKALLQLSWYADTEGASSTQTVLPLRVSSGGGWQPFRLDVTAPPDAVAVGLFLRLAPPPRGSTSADFDDVRVVEWAPPGARFSPLYDHVRLLGSGEVVLSKAALPGGEQWLGLAGPASPLLP